jgi:hypothetical protein
MTTIAMRTTIDIPDPLFRETKALAAMRGITMKDFIIKAIEQAKTPPEVAEAPARARKFPSFHLRSGRKLDLRGFDFDDLLR